VGFDLYCRLLAEAVEELRQGSAGGHEANVLETIFPTISLPVAAHIPKEYISNPSTRIVFYQRLAAVKRVEEIKDMAQELSDRFGMMPQPLENLLYVIEIKQLAAEAMVESISTEDRQIVVHFSSLKRLDRLHRLQGYGDGVKVGSRQIKLDFGHLGNSWQEVLREVLQAAVLDK
jgi:transcription-repair coupling factor (superfamily II helicase)